MLIASWPLQDFAGFLQIISWITLPVLLVAVISTIFLHYYQKRKTVQQDEDVQAGFSLASVLPSDQYDKLKQDFESLQIAYRSNESELSHLNAEVRRQDWVIDELRGNLVSLEKNLDTLKLALQLKDEQIRDMQDFIAERQVPFQVRTSTIAAEIS